MGAFRDEELAGVQQLIVGLLNKTPSGLQALVVTRRLSLGAFTCLTINMNEVDPCVIDEMGDGGVLRNNRFNLRYRRSNKNT